MDTELYDFEEKLISLRKNKTSNDYFEETDEYEFFFDGIDEEYEFFDDIRH